MGCGYAISLVWRMQGGGISNRASEAGKENQGKIRFMSLIFTIQLTKGMEESIWQFTKQLQKV